MSASHHSVILPACESVRKRLPSRSDKFEFTREYSIVVADLNLVSRKTEVDVRDAIARAAGLQFSPVSWSRILGPSGGIVTRFSCLHIVNVLSPFPASYSATVISQNMLGQLEIAALPNVSHRYFPGEKTAIHFQLFEFRTLGGLGRMGKGRGTGVHKTGQR
ncbi:hypothetical protein B0H13DRAFT_1859667 [Mycena leptocephala]|nr:hypothetical protein B0H13DRAFT_1859667 [Mycena leptocephala]